MAGRNKSELGEQTHVINSVRAVGGYGRKISHRFAVGIPDLLLVVPGYVPGIWEMKDMGFWNTDTERQVETTLKQRLELKEFSAACMGNLAPLGTYVPTYTACGVLITYKEGRERYLTICGHGTESIRKKQFPTIVRETGPLYRVDRLFNAFGVEKWKGN